MASAPVESTLPGLFLVRAVLVAACALPLRRAQTVKVVGRKGLTLEVVPLDPAQGGTR